MRMLESAHVNIIDNFAIFNVHVDCTSFRAYHQNRACNGVLKHSSKSNSMNCLK